MFKKFIALFLVILLVASMPLAAYAETNNSVLPQANQHLDEEWFNTDILTEEAAVEEIAEGTLEAFDEEQTISENKRKYLQLLAGRYNNYELRQRFNELFGDEYTGENIYNNYREIFDLDEDEVIDEAFLRVISGYIEDFSTQIPGNLTAEKIFLEDSKYMSSEYLATNEQNNGDNLLDDRLQIQAADASDLNLDHYPRSNIDFYLDRSFTNVLLPNLTNGFLDSTNLGYEKMYNLVNGNVTYGGGKMQIEHTVDLPTNAEGMSGWPILWQLRNVSSYNYLYAIDHAYKMKQLNVETTETPFHEISHNFDNYTWRFEPEALAILKIYYYYTITGKKMAVADDNNIYTGGSGYKTYMKSYADRILGHINYDEAMRQGIYSPYSLAYVLGNMADNIGWQAFTNTFTDFYNTPDDNLPKTDLGKLNLFLTKIKEYSGRDVISLDIPANAKTIFQNYFGGTIAYLPSYTVSFVANGGSPAPQAQTIRQGLKASSPATMTRSGYTFDGWYTTSTFSGSAYNFSTPVTSNLTLYAKWNLNLNVSLNQELYSGSNALFRIKGSNGQELTDTIALKKRTGTNDTRAIATINNTPVPSGVKYSWRYTSPHNSSYSYASTTDTGISEKYVYVGVPDVPGKFQLTLTFKNSSGSTLKTVNYIVFVTFGDITSVSRNSSENGVNVRWLNSAFDKHNPTKDEIVSKLNSAIWGSPGGYIYGRGDVESRNKQNISGTRVNGSCENAADALENLYGLLGLAQTTVKRSFIPAELGCDFVMMTPNRKSFGDDDGYWNGRNINPLNTSSEIGYEDGAWIFGSSGHRISEYGGVYYDPTLGLEKDGLYKHVYAKLKRLKDEYGQPKTHIHNGIPYNDVYNVQLVSNNRVVASIASTILTTNSDGRFRPFDYLYITPPEVTALSSGGDMSILMPYEASQAAASSSFPLALASSNSSSWTAESNASWISIESSAIAPMQATASDMLEIYISPNPTNELRMDTITVNTQEGADTIHIYQDGAAATIETSQDTILAAANSGEYTVDISSNVTWYVSYDADWISLPFASGTGDDELTIVAARNDTGEIRNATLTVNGGGASETIDVTQLPQGGYSLTFSSDSYYTTIPQSGSVTVNAQAVVKNPQGVVMQNIPVNYRISSIQVSEVDSNGVVTIPAGINNGMETIMASAGGLSARATLTLTKITSNLAYDINNDGAFNQVDLELIHQTYLLYTYLDDVWSEAYIYDVDHNSRIEVEDILLLGAIMNNIPVATSIEFTNAPYSAQIPASGSRTQTVLAVVKDQFGNVMSGLKPTLSISPSYDGVTVNSTNGFLTVQSTAAAGAATILATYGSLSATAPLTLTSTAPVATSIAFTGTPYSAQIPSSGSATKTVTAVVKDQFGNVMSSLKPTLSISPTYSGVTIVSSTGVVTIQSTAAAGSATIRATYGSLTAVTTALSLTKAASVATSIAFTGTPYSAQIPSSGSTTKTVTAVVKDQYGVIMSSLKPTLSISPTYSGVMIVSSTGVVTIQSTAAAGSATIRATYGSLTAVTTSLTLTGASSATYTLAFDQSDYDIWVPMEDSVTVQAIAKKNGSTVVVAPELVSIVYSCGGITNTTGLFWEGDLPEWSNQVTAVATFSNGATVQANAWIHIAFIPPSAAPGNSSQPDFETSRSPIELFSTSIMQQMFNRQVAENNTKSLL